MTREFFLKESMIMLSVVIPTFNESKNIRNLVAQIDVALKGVDYEIVFVDDSKDNTPDVIMEVAKEYPQVRMEHRKNGTGLATAVLDGFKLAKGEYMACMDADLQHPPIVLKYMYRAMESGADFCIPSRLIPGGDDGGLNWYRKFVSGTARKIGQVMLPCLRTEGESKLSGKVTLEYLKQLKNLRKRYNKSNRYEVEIWSTERMMKGDK